MKFSIEWLKEWVDPKLSTKELAEQLTMAGLEVDAIAPVAAHFTHVKVGQIVGIEQHPDAERLRVCSVDIGSGAPLQIVCGAANARLHLKTPVALVGAELPNGLAIKKAKLRGVESNGMLCSEVELGLATSSAGIMELPLDAPLGLDLIKYLQLQDETLDLNVTPNRGDCLSILGIAREVAAINQKKLTPVKIKAVKPKDKASFPVELQAKLDCPRYLGRIIRNINPQAKTPIWMRERLRRSDINSIHPIVDITNYVMLELGQPMHAFDLDKLGGAVYIRHAKDGEQLTLLDQQTITLVNDILVIADKNQPLALAGVMGGVASAINDQTQHIFLESAFFTPLAVIKSEKQFNLFSESSRRYSRGVDPELQSRAIERATALILEIAGGEAGPIVEKKGKGIAKTSISLRRDRIKKILGFAITDRQVKEILTSLGMQLAATSSGWQVEVPLHRSDLKIEVDLIEELARLYGYDRILGQLPVAALNIPPQIESKLSLNSLKTTLVNLGYHEAITYSFGNSELQAAFDPKHPGLALLNPISADMAVMRTTLWPSLINVIMYNQNRQQPRVRVFESGLCYRQEGKTLEQQPHLAGAITGNLYPEQWGIKNRNVDFFDVKKDVETLLRLSFAQDSFRFVPGSHPALHPGQTARIEREGKAVGYIGAIHPQLLQKLKFDCQVYLFELELDRISQGKLPKATQLSKFPSMRRDLAFIMDKQIAFDQIYTKVQRTVKEILKNIQLFDIYQGSNMPADKKSIALGLVFQHPTRTLTEDEVNQQVEKVISVLTKDFGAVLRT